MTLTQRPYSCVWEDEDGRPYLEYKYPLRPDADTTFILPRDLTLADVKRIAAFLNSVVVEVDRRAILGAISEDQTP